MKTNLFRWLLFVFAAPFLGWLALRLFAGDRVSASRHPFFDGAPRVLNIAHRGASGERLEHSWEAYDLALRDGADVLELDLRSTSDGILVVAHDADLVRLTGVPLRVADAPLADLRATVGDKAPVPLIDVLARYPGRLNLEIKDNRPEIAERLRKLLRDTGRESSVIVASFHADVLAAFRAQGGPSVATAAHGREALWFYVTYVVGLPASPEFQALQIPPRFKVLDLDSAAFMDYAHRHGLVVHYWTIDDEGEMRELIKRGADGIMTNFPDRLERVIDEMASVPN